MYNQTHGHGSIQAIDNFFDDSKFPTWVYTTREYWFSTGFRKRWSEMQGTNTNRNVYAYNIPGYEEQYGTFPPV